MVRLALWKEELRNLIRFAAKKFVGFQNADSLRKALDIVLGLISVALIDETGGKEEPAKWSGIIVSRNFMDLVKKAIALAEQIQQGADGKPYPYLFEIDRPSVGTKDLLVFYATSKTKDKWTGYDRYLGDQERAAQSKKEDQLLRWLIVHLLGESPGKISEHHPLLEEAISTGEVINSLMLRRCSGLGVLDKSKKKIIVLNKDEFILIRKKYDAGPAAWLSAAQKQYTAFLGEIPPALRPGLGKGDWFATHLKKGPPKVTAKTAMAETIPSITGIYYYDLMG